MIGFILYGIGSYYYYYGEYEKAIKYLDDSIDIHNKIGNKFVELNNNVYKYLSYKYLGKTYDIKDIHILIKEKENISFEINQALFKLLEDTSYLEAAYNQIQEKAHNLEPDVKAKFLSYPIPKAIVEGWEKVK